MPFWRPAEPLVLASQSAVRRKILESAGLPVEVHPADIDERAIEQAAMPASPPQIACVLAAAKAQAVAGRAPGRIVLAADQTLSCDGRLYSKATSRAAVRDQLAALRGRTHELHAAVVVHDTRAGESIFTRVETARLTMRSFSDAFLDSYLDQMGEAACATVGGYQLEGIGIHLFRQIEGDYFTILGLPIVPVLAYMREQGHVRI